MNDFGQTLFGGSPLIRWTIGPAIVIFLAAFTLIIPDWNVRTVSLIAGLYLLGIPMILGLFIPSLGRIVFRIVTSLVFLAYLAYLIIELVESNWTISRSASRSESSAFNALIGLLIIGIPCLIYTINGRFTFARKKEEEEREHAPPAGRGEAPRP